MEYPTGRTPDERDIVDITTEPNCNYCGKNPTPVILVDYDGNYEWECYGCGKDPDWRDK